MKATISISIEVADLGDLPAINRMFEELGAAVQTTKASPVTEPDSEETEEPKPKPKKARKKAAKKAAPAEVEEPAESEALEPEVIKVTEDEIKAAVHARVAHLGLDEVSAVFEKVGNAKNLTAVDKSKWPELLAALKDGVPE